MSILRDADNAERRGEEALRKFQSFLGSDEADESFIPSGRLFGVSPYHVRAAGSERRRSDLPYNSMLVPTDTSLPLSLSALGDDGQPMDPMHLLYNQYSYIRPPAKSEESTFYQHIEDTMEEVSGAVTGVPLDAEAQVLLAETYAMDAAQRHDEALRNLNRAREASKSRGRGAVALLQAEAHDARTERDLWSLLAILMRSGLLKNIDDDNCQSSLCSAIESIAPSAPLRRVVDLCLETDDRIKKGRVLKDWLENGAVDLVNEPPLPRNPMPWLVTLGGILNDENGLNTLHPDVQLGPGGVMQPLAGEDVADQETVMKVVWQYIRSGQLVRAQEVAKEHGWFWLSGCLLGAAEEYSTVEGENIRTKGNKRRALWMQTCWRYSSMIDEVPVSKKQQLDLPALESAVYSALSGNLRTLNRSRLLVSWSDRLWATVKCCHERQLAEVVHGFHQKRADHSALYRGCDKSTLEAEDQLLSYTNDLRGAIDGSCDGLFKLMPPPSADCGSEATVLFLELQVALIRGVDALRAHIQATVSRLVRKEEGGEDSLFSNVRCRILRVYTHLLLWLHFSCFENSVLRDIAPNKVLHSVVEAYIEHLIHRRQYSLVALYASFLSRPRRVAKYASMMRQISPVAAQGQTMEDSIKPYDSYTADQSRVDDSATASEVLQLAQKFFQREEVLEIAKEVVEEARKGDSEGTVAADLDTTIALSPVRSHLHQLHTPGTLHTHTHRRIETPATHGFTETPGRGHGIEERSLVVSNTVDDTPDSRRMESLKWLCFSNYHRVAVIEANAFMRSLMLESDGEKTRQVHTLLWDILPEGCLEEGERQHDIRMSQMYESPDRDDRLISAEIDMWDAAASQMCFWRGFDVAVDRHMRWMRAISQFYETTSSMIGDSSVSQLKGYGYDIERAAKVALDGIRNTLLCYPEERASEAVKSMSALGYQDVWCRAIKSVCGSILVELEQLLATDVEESDDDISAQECKTLLNEVTAMSAELEAPVGSCHATESVSCLRDADCATIATSSLFDYPQKIQYALELLQAICHKFCFTRVYYDALVKTRDAISCVLENRKTMYLLSAQLLTTYIKVCTETAEVMETLQCKEQALDWYQRAVQLADFIAEDEHPHLQLYKSLKGADIKAILGAIHHAAMEILRLNSSRGFSIDV